MVSSAVQPIRGAGRATTMTKWMTLGFGLVAAGVGGWALSVADAERYLSPTFLVQWLQGSGPLAPFLLIVSMAGAVVVPPIPSLPLDVAAGAVFGPFWGTVYAIIGAEFGAIVSFLIARAIGRETLSKLLTADAVFCQTCTDHQLMWLMFFARLIPVFSFDVVSYGAGLTNLSLRTFALATFFGMIPPTFAFTYLGSSVVSGQWLVIAAGVAMVVLFLVIPQFLAARRSSALARMFLGPLPPRSSQREIPLVVRCVGCGAVVGAPSST